MNCQELHLCPVNKKRNVNSRRQLTDTLLTCTLKRCSSNTLSKSPAEMWQWQSTKPNMWKAQRLKPKHYPLPGRWTDCACVKGAARRKNAALPGQQRSLISDWLNKNKSNISHEEEVCLHGEHFLLFHLLLRISLHYMINSRYIYAPSCDSQAVRRISYVRTR